MTWQDAGNLCKRKPKHLGGGICFRILSWWWFWLFLLPLFSGCSMQSTEGIRTIHVFKVAPIVSTIGSQEKNNPLRGPAFSAVVTYDFQVLTIQDEKLAHKLIPGAWYACSVKTFEDGSMLIDKADGPVEPVELKHKKIMEMQSNEQVPVVAPDSTVPSVSAADGVRAGVHSN